MKLQFDQTLIPKIAARYSYEEDVKPLDAGRRIRSGEYTRENLQTIFEWKTKGRGRSRLGKNSDEDIADALRLAITAKTDRAAVAVLLGLNGVQAPVASALLTAIDPERFTIFGGVAPAGTVGSILLGKVLANLRPGSCKKASICGMLPVSLE
jgi:hypothetical protein